MARWCLTVRRLRFFATSCWLGWLAVLDHPTQECWMDWRVWVLSAMSCFVRLLAACEMYGPIDVISRSIPNTPSTR